MHEPGTYLNPWCADEPAETKEKFFLLCCLVAGKKASAQQRSLEVLLSLMEQAVGFDSPAAMLHKVWVRDRRPRDLAGHDAQRLVAASLTGRLLKTAGTGQYTRLVRLFATLASHLDQQRDFLDTATREQLCTIPGIGMKTASFYLLHSRHGQRIACLDVHILEHMRRLKLHPDVPDSTPSSDVKKYLDLERVWLEWADSQGRTSAELDFEIWKNQSGY